MTLHDVSMDNESSMDEDSHAPWDHNAVGSWDQNASGSWDHDAIRNWGSTLSTVWDHVQPYNESTEEEESTIHSEYEESPSEMSGEPEAEFVSSDDESPNNGKWDTTDIDMMRRGEELAIPAISHEDFADAVREVMEDLGVPLGEELEMTKPALLALHQAVEDYMLAIMESAAMIAESSGVEEVGVSHIHTAQVLANRWRGFGSSCS